MDALAAILTRAMRLSAIAALVFSIAVAVVAPLAGLALAGQPVGTYAVKLCFSDGHDTGLYSWDLLYEIGLNQDELWGRYLKRLGEAGASREPQPGFETRPKSK